MVKLRLTSSFSMASIPGRILLAPSKFTGPRKLSSNDVLIRSFWEQLVGAEVGDNSPFKSFLGTYYSSLLSNPSDFLPPSSADFFDHLMELTT